jgi:hypothetical protein
VPQPEIINEKFNFIGFHNNIEMESRYLINFTLSNCCTEAATWVGLPSQDL